MTSFPTAFASQFGLASNLRSVINIKQWTMNINDIRKVTRILTLDICCDWCSKSAPPNEPVTTHDQPMATTTSLFERPSLNPHSFIQPPPKKRTSLFFFASLPKQNTKPSPGEFSHVLPCSPRRLRGAPRPRGANALTGEDPRPRGARSGARSKHRPRSEARKSPAFFVWFHC